MLPCSDFPDLISLEVVTLTTMVLFINKSLLALLKVLMLEILVETRRHTEFVGVIYSSQKLRLEYQEKDSTGDLLK